MSEDNTNTTNEEDGWTELGPAHIPSPTAAPFFFAMGLSWAFWGFVTNFIVGWIGFAVFVLALIKWVRDLFHDQHQH